MGIEDHPRRREPQDYRDLIALPLGEVPPRLRKYERRITNSTIAVVTIGRPDGDRAAALD